MILATPRAIRLTRILIYRNLQPKDLDDPEITALMHGWELVDVNFGSAQGGGG